MKDEPSLADWKELYEAAAEFGKIGCWNWMWDSDMFGVQDTETGEIGYCCVMGRLKQYFALALYLGSEGLEGYLKVQRGDIAKNDPEFVHVQKCLMSSFEDKDFLEKQDKEITRKLKLKFRGKKSWPFFRNYSPGYYPAPLKKSEAKFLALALRQAKEVCLRFKKYPYILAPPREGFYLVRFFSKKKNIWENRWMKPLPLEKKKIEPHFDEILLEKVKHEITWHKGVWEVDYFYAPFPVHDGEIPYNPRLILFADHESGFVMGHHTQKPEESISELSNRFLEMIEKAGYLPKETIVKKEDALKLIKPVASELGIKIRITKKLKMIEEACRGMLEYMEREGKIHEEAKQL